MPNSDVVEGRRDVRFVYEGVEEAKRRETLAQSRIVHERYDTSEGGRASRCTSNQTVLATDYNGEELATDEQTATQN